jgi:hypothetical protein
MASMSSTVRMGDCAGVAVALDGVVDDAQAVRHNNITKSKFFGVFIVVILLSNSFYPRT